MRLTRIALILTAIAYAGVGLPFVAFPRAMASLVDIGLNSVTADNDLRAVYGGLGLGIAAFFLVSSAKPSWHRAALTAAALTFAGLVAARVLSWLVVGFPSPLALGLHLLETGGGLMCLVALRRLPEER